MPVSSSEQPVAKICKFCNETPHCNIWNIKIDRDILDTIRDKFPSWFLSDTDQTTLKYNLKYLRLQNYYRQSLLSNMSLEEHTTTQYSSDKPEIRVSPPKAIIDSSSLTQSAMDKNRESLKVKLMVRRSVNQLVEQGIMPSLKTSPAIHEQKKLLERAKTGDFLKSKIQQRPDRQELERRHILESHESHIDPSLADKYRMLEKAILVDQLNSKISHRPGPLELIEKNILHANEPIERIVKEGLVPYKLSADEAQEKNVLSFEDDSQSSEGDLNHMSNHQHPQAITIDRNIKTEVDLTKSVEQNAIRQQQSALFDPPSGIINISLAVPNTTASIAIPASFKIQTPTDKTFNEITTIKIPPPPPPPKLELIAYHIKPVIQTTKTSISDQQCFFQIPISEASNILPSSTQLSQIQNINQQSSPFSQNNLKHAAPGKDKNRKKCKSKAISKTRAIKFHEYKGPPNAYKSNTTSTMLATASAGINKKIGETNYELIMQQQCLLEYLEGIYKNPNAIKSAESDPSPTTKNIIKFEKTPESMKKEEREKLRSNSMEKSAVKIMMPSKPQITIFPSKPSTGVSSSNAVQQSQEISDAAKLSKMKVSELKAYLKKFNLPVSGPKPLLLERLKPYLPLGPLDDIDEMPSSSNIHADSSDVYNTSVQSVSSTESEVDLMDVQQQTSVTFNQPSSSSSIEDDIVREQQRKIEELQRKLQQSQNELEKMKQSKSSDSLQQLMLNDQSSNASVVSEKVFQIFSPTNTKQMQTNVLYDSQGSPNPLSTVYVVDVSQSSSDATQSENNSIVIAPAAIPMPTLMSIHNEIANNQNAAQNHTMKEEVTSSTSKLLPSTPSIAMSQDITDVLEILLKNGEWPNMDGDLKIKESDYNQLALIQSRLNENKEGHDIIMSPKNFLHQVSSSQSYNILSPMNEEPISPILNATEESIDKILDSVPSSHESIFSQQNYSASFNDANCMDFPMDVEEQTAMPYAENNFNKSIFQNNMEKLYQNVNQKFDHSSMNETNMKNCDIKLNGYTKCINNTDKNSNQLKSQIKQEIVKSEFSDMIDQKPLMSTSTSGTKNGLIGNFDQNLFDSLRNNNNNSNSHHHHGVSDIFLNAFDGKMSKEDDKNLHILNNYEMFNGGCLEATPMDFESIIPYDLQPHDSLFHISSPLSFDNTINRNEAFNNINNNLFFNDDTRMSNSDSMCEVDNLLCNL